MKHIRMSVGALVLITIAKAQSDAAFEWSIRNGAPITEEEARKIVSHKGIEYITHLTMCSSEFSEKIQIFLRKIYEEQCLHGILFIQQQMLEATIL